MAVDPIESAPAEPAYELAVVDVRRGRVSIRATGALGLAAADDLTLLLASELAGGHVFIRVDLSRVSSVDSSCVGALEHAHDGCLASQGLLLLEGLGDGSGRDLATTELDRSLFVGRTTGPAEWLPDVRGLADLVRQERLGRASRARARGRATSALPRS